MANRIKGITVEIGGDTTGLSKALSGVNKEITSTQKGLKDVEKLLKLDPTNTELLRQKHQMLGKEIEATKTKLDTLKEAEKQLLNAGVDKNSEQFMALEREIIDTENALRQLETQASKSHVALAKITAEADKIAAGADKVYQSTKMVSGAALALGGTAVKASADFEQQLSNVQALCGATEEEMELLRGKAKEMGETTKFSAAESAEALSYMALAGWDTQQMLDGLPGIMYLAAASNEDLATTSDIVTDALTAFNLTAEDSAHFSDVLAVAMSHSNTTVGMLGEAFKYVAPLAGTAGYSIEDTAVALGLMANAGIKSTQAGTTLRQALMNLVSPTKSQKDAMDALGLSLTNSDGSMKTLDEVMQMLRQQFAGLSVDVVDADGNLREYEDIMADLEAQNIDTATAQKMQYAATIFGARGLSGMLAIVNATEESYQGLKDSIYATVDAEESAAQQMANIQLDNLNGQITLLKSALEGAAISIGEKLTPYIAGLVEKVQATVDWFNGLTDAQVALIAKAILLVAAIAPVAKTISLIASGVSGLTGTVIPGCIKAVDTVSEKVIPALGKAMSWLLANPMALVVAAIIALVALIATKGDEIQGLLNRLNDWLQGFFAKDFTEIFGPILGSALNAFLANVRNIWNSAKQIFDGIINFIRGVFTGDWQRAWEGVKQIFSGAFGALASLAKAPLNALIGLLNGAIGGINRLIRGFNNMGFTMPSWLGGGSWHPSIPTIGTIPYLASGGILSKGSAIVGEAGPELLTMQGSQAVVQPLTNNNTTTHNLGGVTINVYGAAGQDIHELANIIMDEMQAATDRKGAVFA